MTFSDTKIIKMKYKSKKQPRRSEIPEKYKWKTSHIFKDDRSWEESFRRIKRLIPEIGKFKGTLGDSAENLYNCLKIRDRIDIQLGKLSIYANLKSDEDTRTSKYQEYREKISQLEVLSNQNKSFIHPEILQIPDKILKIYLETNVNLKIYKHYFDDLLRSRDHILNREGENLLALAGDMAHTPYQVFSMFNNADITFPKIKDERNKSIELTKGNFSIYIRSNKRTVRKRAYKAMYGSYQNWLNTLAANLAGAIKSNIYFARARNYNSAMDASLDVDNISISVYENVLNTLHNNVNPMHKYIRLRKNILKLDRVYPWDLYVPLVKELKWEISYENALKITEKALYPLGSGYLKYLPNAFTGGWFDVFENRGKRSGAYSTAVYDIPHPYILLNYQGMLEDLFTVVHELGHSMHSYFTIKTQPYIYSNYTIFVAEVASTLNEALLIDYLINNTSNKQKKIYLINHYIDQIRGTLYIQAMFAEFEKKIHEIIENGEALTTEILNKIIREIYCYYYGKDFIMNSLYEINWCRIPHFYYNFYVYQYATGISAATTLAQKILQGNAESRDAYLEFLKRGSADYSINLLKDAGVDMTSPEPIETTIKFFSNLVDQLENLLQH